MNKTQDQKNAEKDKQKTVATEADKDEHTVAMAAPPDGSGTEKEYQIEHGKAPIEPGVDPEVSEEDAAAAKVNRGRGLGG